MSLSGLKIGKRVGSLRSLGGEYLKNPCRVGCRFANAPRNDPTFTFLPEAALGIGLA